MPRTPRTPRRTSARSRTPNRPLPHRPDGPLRVSRPAVLQLPAPQGGGLPEDSAQYESAAYDSAIFEDPIVEARELPAEGITTIKAEEFAPLQPLEVLPEPQALKLQYSLN